MNAVLVGWALPPRPPPEDIRTAETAEHANDPTRFWRPPPRLKRDLLLLAVFCALGISAGITLRLLLGGG